MHRLCVVVFSLVAPTLCGVGAVVALVAGGTGVWTLLGSALLGGLVAVPVSYGVSRALSA
jgi:hypothetical protein